MVGVLPLRTLRHLFSMPQWCTRISGYIISTYAYIYVRPKCIIISQILRLYTTYFPKQFPYNSMRRPVNKHPHQISIHHHIINKNPYDSLQNNKNTIIPQLVKQSSTPILSWDGFTILKYPKCIPDIWLWINTYTYHF